ncbi:MAG: ATP-dependent DNA helicase [Firmicutes bacterium]|nr:ATP-dependent DNA helicase [Bacillota bacterium]
MNPWITEKIEPEEKFRASLVTRAKKRTVVPAGENVWRVAGDPKLGDTYPVYRVVLNGKRYSCSCYTHYWGESRANRVCSHVLAVIMYRRKHKLEPKPAIPDPRDPMFGDPPLPDWVKAFRPHQWEAIEEVVKAFKKARVVFLDAPTGAGKTLIAEVARRLLKTRALYLCTTKTLQDQFTGDFPYAALLKGRNNYPTFLYPERFNDPEPYRLTAAECDIRRVTDDAGEEEKTQWCPWCGYDVDKCPYRMAKAAAAANFLSVLNTAYFLNEINGAQPVFKDWPLVVIDEADQLEQELMRYIEIEISRSRLKKLGLGMPEKKTVAESWYEWIEKQAIPAVEEAIREVKKDGKSLRAIKELNYLTKLYRKLITLAPEVRNGNWVFTGYEEGNVIFKPIQVNNYARQRLWNHGKKFLLMSATIISPEQLAEDLGLENHEWAAVRVRNTFPKENRPIYVMPKADMTRNNKETAWPELAEAVRKIIDHHKHDRILVHTVSYDLTRYLAENLSKERVITYVKADERDRVLAEFRAKEGAVLLAPSFDRGIDLPEDDCRVVICAKCPFPSLGDRQVSARLHKKGGENWYRVLTVRTLVQMCGRAMRSAEDHCSIYLIDKQFVSNIWKKSRHLLPEWWKEALVWSGNPSIK